MSTDKVVSYPSVTPKGSQLPPQLRVLPSEAVTKDIDDPDRAHALDPQHIVNDIAKDYLEERKAPEQKPEAFRPVTQEEVDLRALLVCKAIVATNRLLHRSRQEPRWHVRHLWFPENDARVYELRDGNPPADSERPDHLRRIDLVVDPTAPLRRLAGRLLNDDGTKLDPMLSKMLDHARDVVDELADE